MLYGKSETAWDDDSIEGVEQPLDQQGQRSSRDGPLEDQVRTPELDAGKDGIPQSSGADQGSDGGGSDVDHGAGLDPGHDRWRRHRQLDSPQLGPLREPQRGGRLVQTVRDRRQANVGIADDR